MLCKQLEKIPRGVMNHDLTVVRLVRSLSVAVVTVLGEVHDALVVVLVRLSVDDSQPVLWHSVSHDDSLQ